ncbi:MAG: hypothetical protein FJW23_13790 [Acidimicrobiia bacterium]|nr:hypothetical protein [Acidimicrobiia bacterium]
MTPRSTFVRAAALLGMLPLVAAAQAPPAAPTPSPGGPTPPAVPAAPVGVCTIVGPVLRPTDFGVPAGQPVADATAVRLADGRVRLYAFAQGLGIVSAVSLTPAGVSFVAEPGVRLPDGSGMPRAVVLADGRVRLFYTSGNGIRSATSLDGLTFVDESGFRLTAVDAGFAQAASPVPGAPSSAMPGAADGATSGPTIVPLADGRFRMYFSDLPRPGGTPGGHLVKSAVSIDQLTWTVESGVRLGVVGQQSANVTPPAPGDTPPLLGESAEHPFALSNPDGSVTLYYGKFGNTGSPNAEGVYLSTSADGLTFAEEALAVPFGNDPDALRQTDGTVLLYYGTFDPLVGGTINVSTCPDPTPVAPAPPVQPPASGAPPSAAPLTVRIVGTFGSGAFTPNPLQAVAGDRVVFTNQDHGVHHLVLNDAASTVIGTLQPGQSSAPLTLASGGVSYHCTLHPSMVGTLGTAAAPPATTAPSPAPPTSGPPAGEPPSYGSPPSYDGYALPPSRQ